MQSTPDPSRTFRRTLDSEPLEGFDLRARRVQKELNLLFDHVHFETVQANDFISSIDW